MSFPYSYYRCSCTNERQQNRRPNGTLGLPQTNNGANETDEEDLEDQDETFNPSDPKSNFELYPLENLMWCDSCHDIRCPRCTSEEIICYYCPNCLFEVPSTTVRSEGNRCTRNCFNCPECTAQLTINSIDPDPSSTAGPYILNCDYCNWNSLDVDMKFSNPRGIHQHLLQLSSSTSSSSKSSKRLSSTSSRVLETVPEPDLTSGEGERKRGGERDTSPLPGDARKPRDPASRFNALRAFYKTQLNSTGSGEGLFGQDLNYSSPSNLSRVLAMYSSARSGSRAAGGAKPAAMREAADASEGLQIFSPELDEARVQRLKDEGWGGTVTMAQMREQQFGGAVPTTGAGIRFTKELKPMATLLRTKRSSRCKACKHILVKPEAKIGRTSYRIKLAAIEHVPRMTLTPLAVSGARIEPGAGGGEQQLQQQQPLPQLQQSRSGADTGLNLQSLPPSRTLQFLLKVTNPIFETGIRMTLATPQETPSGAARVTILCPQFDIGANMDVWDEALRGSAGGHDRNASVSSAAGTGSTGTTTPLTSRPMDGASGAGATGAAGGGSQIAEAGKVWERGRNWTSVVVEVVPKRLSKPTDMLDEDENVLEIPIFVRLEYARDGQDGGAPTATASTTGTSSSSGVSGGAGAGSAAGVAAAAGGGGGGNGGAASGANSSSGKKKKRQLSYWTVLGVGRIAADSSAGLGGGDGGTGLRIS